MTRDWGATHKLKPRLLIKSYSAPTSFTCYQSLLLGFILSLSNISLWRSTLLHSRVYFYLLLCTSVLRNSVLDIWYVKVDTLETPCKKDLDWTHNDSIYFYIIDKCKGITLEVCLVTWVGSHLRAIILLIAFSLSPVFPSITYCVIPLKLLLDLVWISVRYHKNGALTI